MRRIAAFIVAYGLGGVVVVALSYGFATSPAIRTAATLSWSDWLGGATIAGVMFGIFFALRWAVGVLSHD